jgi:hypothetical protein
MVRQAIVQYTGDDIAASQLISELRMEFYNRRG